MLDSFDLSLEIAKIRRRIFRNYEMARLVTFLCGSLLLLIVLFFILTPVARLAKELFFGPVGFFSVVLPSRQEIKNTNGRTNILLLGTGGAAHDGPNLTDTIIVASVKTKFDVNENASQFPIVLISIPRDIYINSLGKINLAYSIGAEKGNGAGLILTKGAVSEITGIPIHYGARVDFSAFEQIVDILGGLDIKVENSFDDFQYPKSGKENDTCGLTPEEIVQIMNTPDPETGFPCRFERLHFDAGMQHMDGSTVLKFVRSRHAQGDEGTDFARSKRQQIIIAAIKTKIFSTDTFLHPDKIEQIYNLVAKHIDTDIESGQVNNILKLALNYRGSKFENVVLETDFLDNPPIDERGWILIPKSGNWDQIHKYIKKRIGI